MIEIVNIEKKFYGFHLRNINLTIKPGTIFGLVGPNGAGKSTLIKIITGLLEQTSGDVKYFGKLFKADDVKAKKQLGVLSEKTGLFEYLTILEYLVFISGVYNIKVEESDSRINEMLKLFNLQAAKGKFINELSTGMRKKTALIGAFIHTPKIVILDEPFENIDPNSINILKKILLRMRNNNKIIFLSSHILPIVEDICDETAIINNGKIVYQSSAKNIRNKIKNDLTDDTYQSLEEIFLELTTDAQKYYQLPSWI